MVRSIGCGNTDKLSSFYHEPESTKSAENHESTNSENSPQNNATKTGTQKLDQPQH